MHKLGIQYPPIWVFRYIEQLGEVLVFSIIFHRTWQSLCHGEIIVQVHSYQVLREEQARVGFLFVSWNWYIQYLVDFRVDEKGSDHSEIWDGGLTISTSKIPGLWIAPGVDPRKHFSVVLLVWCISIPNDLVIGVFPPATCPEKPYLECPFICLPLIICNLCMMMDFSWSAMVLSWVVTQQRQFYNSERTSVGAGCCWSLINLYLCFLPLV